MMIKKMYMIFIIILIIPTICLADDFIEESEPNEYIETSNNLENTKKEPITNSKHIVAIDRKSHTVLYEKDSYSEVPMASTTKIMTAIIAIENCDLTETLEFSKEATNVRGSCLEVSTGAKISMNDALYGLMMRSGNDCAVAIAEHISGSTEEFAKLMNQKAQELHLTHTNFVTPHGLDDKNHYTTAYELAILTDYALKNPTFKTIVGTKTATISVNGVPRTISNTNELLGNLNGVYGVKTGFTFEAGRCLVSSCNRNGLDIIVVVLGADTKKQRTQDSIKIINYIYDNFEYVDISSYINETFSKYNKSYLSYVNLYKTRTVPKLQLSKLDNYEFPLKPNSSNLLSSKFYCINTLSSKLDINSKIGVLTIFYDNKILCSIDVVLSNKLKPNTWFYYFINILKNPNMQTTPTRNCA